MIQKLIEQRFRDEILFNNKLNEYSEILIQNFSTLILEVL